MHSPTPLACRLSCAFPTRISVVVAILLAIPGSWIGAIDTELDAWRCDLRHLLVELPRIHPAPFSNVERSRFESEIFALEDRLGDLEGHEIVVDLARIVALIGDGHTRVTLPLDPGIEFFQGHTGTEPARSDLVMRQFPVRFGWYQERLLITAMAEHVAGSDQLLGREVLEIGGMPIEEVVAAVSPAIERDNDWQVRYHLPQRLALADILHARRVIDDRERLPLRVDTANGPETVVLSVVPLGETVAWKRVLQEPPLSLGPLDQPFLLTETLPGLLYLRIDEIGDGPREALADLAARLEQTMARPGFERLVIDLRHNRGGDGSLSRPLLHALIRSPALSTAGSLFVLVGRETFSAAMMLTVDLERHTRAIFVGEPTGSSPNHFGDSSKQQLPHSKLTVRISTRQWQYSHPLDQRSAIEPTVLAPHTVDSVLEQRDPALEWIQGFASGTETLSGRFEGRLSYLRGLYSFSVTLADDSVVLDLPELGVSGLPARDVEREGERLRFGVDLGPQSFTIEAEIRGDWMVGYVDDRRRGGTLALRRSSSP